MAAGSSGGEKSCGGIMAVIMASTALSQNMAKISGDNIMAAENGSERRRSAGMSIGREGIKARRRNKSAWQKIACFAAKRKANGIA